MSTISIAVITHNEESVIKGALDSVAWAEQIVVVDCGSTDSTAAIARSLGAEIHSEPNRANLNINKNIAIRHCTKDWIFVLDADERIPYDLAGEIRCLINARDADGYLVPRRNFMLGRWIRRGSQYPDYQLRLFRRGRGEFPAVHVHERLKVDGKVGKLTEPFDHFPFPDLDTMIAKNLRYIDFEAEHLYRMGKRITIPRLIFILCIAAPFRFFRRYFLKGGFLDGMQGLIRVWFDGFNQVMRWIRLYELQRKDRKPGD